MPIPPLYQSIIEEEQVKFLKEYAKYDVKIRLPYMCWRVNTYLDKKQEENKRSEWTIKAFNILIGVDRVRKVFPRNGKKEKRPELIVAARISLALGLTIKEAEECMFLCGYELSMAINDTDMSDVVVAIRAVYKILGGIESDEAKKVNLFNFICRASQKFDEEKEKKQNKEKTEKNK